MKLKITLIGKVHDVGYRPLLLGLAESLEIERFFADNVFIDGKQALEILIDDSEDKVKAFTEIVKRKKPENAEIESITIEDYEGRVMKTESYYRYLTAMQLEKMVICGGKMLEKQDTMLGKMDLMLEKQDKTIEEIKDAKRVIKEESKKTREEIGGKVDSVADKIDLLRVDMKEYMEQRFSALSNKPLIE